MDLSMLSDADFQALQAGNLAGVSDAGLDLLMGKQAPPEAPPARPELQQRLANLGLGAVRGAGSIGATIMAPIDYAARQMGVPENAWIGRTDRRQAMDDALAGAGADTQSLSYGGGKLASEVAGTLGVGPLIGGSAAAIPALAKTAPTFINALQNYGAGGAAAGHLVTRMLGGGVSTGASAGLAEPDTSGTGAMIGAAIPVVGKGVNALAQSPVGGFIKKTAMAPYRVIEPYLPWGKKQIEGRTLNLLAGDKRDEVLASLDNAQSNIPFSHPNAGQAAVPSGSTTFAAGHREISEQADTATSAALEKAQEEARLRAIKRISKSNEEGSNAAAVAAAEKVRETAAKSDYSRAFRGVIESDPIFSWLAERPSIEKAFSRAKELAKEKSKVLVIGENKPAQMVSGKIVNEAGEPLLKTLVPEEVAKYPVESLHYIKLSLDDMIKNPERFGIGASERGAIAETRAKLLEWLDRSAPAYKRARDRYSKLSMPVNSLQVGQTLENALTSPLQAAERPGVFANAMRNAPQTIKSSTGRQMFDELDQVLTVGQEAGARGVKRDLLRDAEYSRLASAGGKEASEILGTAMKPHTPPGMLSTAMMVARTAISRMQGKASKDVIADLAKIMQSPERTAELMRLAKPDERFALDRVMRTISSSVRNPLMIGTAVATSDY